MSTADVPKTTERALVRLLWSLFAGIITLVAGSWLNMVPLRSRWDDIAYQLDNSLDLDPYPLGWPQWYFHDFSDGTADIAALTLDVGLLVVSAIGMSVIVWRYYHRLSSVRWSLSAWFVVLSLLGTYFGIYASASPSSELLTIDDLCLMVVMAGIGGAWWNILDLLHWLVSTNKSPQELP